MVRVGNRTGRPVRRIRKKTARMSTLSRFMTRNKVYPFDRYVNIGSEITNANFTVSNGTGCVFSATSATSGVMTLAVNNGPMVPAFSSFGYQFNLLALPSLTDFTTLFDSYRIRKVKIVITPFSNSAGTTFAGSPNTSSEASGFIHYAIDNDGVPPPTSSEVGVQELQQRAGYKVKRIIGDKPIKITVRPRYAQSAYVSGISTGYTQGDPNAWIDLTYTTLPHYGVIGVIEGYTPNNAEAKIALRIETKYTLEFKTPR